MGPQTKKSNQKIDPNYNGGQLLNNAGIALKFLCYIR